MIAFFTYIGAGEDETKLANKVLPRYKKQLTPEYDSGSGTGPCDITQMIESLGANLKGSYVKVATRHCDGVKGWNPNTADVETWKPLTLMQLRTSNALGQPETQFAGNEPIVLTCNFDLDSRAGARLKTQLVKVGGLRASAGAPTRAPRMVSSRAPPS